MWSHGLSPSGNGFLALKGQPKRDFSMMGTILPSKDLKNSNFVNNVVNTIDVFAKKSTIISSIEEQCPEIFPSTNTPRASSLVCHEPCKKMRKDKSRKQKVPRKNSKKHQKEQQIKDMLPSKVKTSEPKESSFSPTKRTFCLGDFIVNQPSTKIELPIVNKAEMVLTITQTPSCRPRQISECDSDDSFIVFGDEDNQSGPRRSRQVSLCESEDSFIIFESDDTESESFIVFEKEEDDEKCGPCKPRRVSICESEDSFVVFESDDAVSELSIEEDDTSEEDSDDEDSSTSVIKHKKVRFVSDDKLCEVHPMIKWSYAYQAARKGPWEQHARDRSRFKDRSMRVGEQIKNILDPVHRSKIYRERFEEST